MSAGKNILIIFLSIILVVSLFISATLLTTNALLYPEIYVEAIEKSDTSELFDFENSTSEIPGGEFIEIPEDDINALAEELLTNFLEYLRGDSEELNLTIELNGTVLREFFEQEAEKFPVCSEGQNPYNQNGEPVCRPANQTATEFLDEVLEINNITFPENEQINLAEVYGLEESNIEEVKSHVKTYRIILYGFIILSLILGGLIFFILKNPEKGTLIVGINLAVSGIMVIVITSILTPMAAEAINIEFEFFKNFVSSITSSLISTYKTHGMIMAIVGLTATAVPAALIIKEKNSQKGRLSQKS